MATWRKPFDADTFAAPRGEIHILRDQCKGCGFCVEYCPKGVLSLSKRYNLKGYHPPEVVKQGECVDCRLCEMLCPDFAIYVIGSNGRAPTRDLPQGLGKEAGRDPS